MSRKIRTVAIEIIFLKKLAQNKIKMNGKIRD